MARTGHHPAGATFPRRAVGAEGLRHHLVLHGRRGTRPRGAGSRSVSFGSRCSSACRRCRSRAAERLRRALPGRTAVVLAGGLFRRDHRRGDRRAPQFGAQLPTGHSTMHLYPIDGAGEPGRLDATAFAYRDGGWAGVIAGVDPDPANAEADLAVDRATTGELHPHSAGGALHQLPDGRGAGPGARVVPRQLRPARAGQAPLRPRQPLPHQPEHPPRRRRRLRKSLRAIGSPPWSAGRHAGPWQRGSPHGARPDRGKPRRACRPPRLETADRPLRLVVWALGAVSRSDGWAARGTTGAQACLRAVSARCWPVSRATRAWWRPASVRSSRRRVGPPELPRPQASGRRGDRAGRPARSASRRSHACYPGFTRLARDAPMARAPGRPTSGCSGRPSAYGWHQPSAPARVDCRKAPLLLGYCEDAASAGACSRDRAAAIASATSRRCVRGASDCGA